MPNRRTVALSAATVAGIAAVMGKPQITFFSMCSTRCSSAARSVRVLEEILKGDGSSSKN
jgi:hypothetical protein